LHRRFDGQPPRESDIFGLGMWQGHAGSTAEPGSAAVFLVMRRLLGMVMRDLSLA
jgi:hypothetical protein